MWLGSWGREWSRGWVWHGEMWRHVLEHPIKRAGVRGTHWQARECPCGTGLGRGWGEVGEFRATAPDQPWEAADRRGLT